MSVLPGPKDKGPPWAINEVIYDMYDGVLASGIVTHRADPPQLGDELIIDTQGTIVIITRLIDSYKEQHIKWEARDPEHLDDLDPVPAVRALISIEKDTA